MEKAVVVQDNTKKPWKRVVKTEKSFSKRLLHLACCGTTVQRGGIGQQKRILIKELKRIT